MKNFFASRIFFIVALILAALAILLGVFKIGEFVGARRASFSYRWSENYGSNFDGMRRNGPGMPGFPQEGFLASHGALGRIVKIENGFLTISSPQEGEKLVVLSGETEIRRFRSPASIADLRIGNDIAVLGAPNEKGQINADIIRILPTSPEGNNASPSSQK